MSRRQTQQGFPAWPGSKSGIGFSQRVGPYTGVDFDRTIEFSNGRKFRIITYQAYNACGLIGSEYNGVAILDEDQHRVLCDNIAAESTGYNGVSRRQWKEAIRICRMPWEHFEAFVDTNPRKRYSL
jgi:hypothetical protein